MRSWRKLLRQATLGLTLGGLLLTAACQPVRVATTVAITLSSSQTKEDWINTVTEAFNAARIETTSGNTIQVRVVNGNSGGSLSDILQGKSQPTLWSPGDLSWVADANAQWQALTGQRLITSDCPETIYEPTGYAMWRPMAEAMGWPDQAIGWQDILALAEDPTGWARYGHPEWGELKLGHTTPSSSNSGLLILTALVYHSLGVQQGLTPEAIRSERVAVAMRLIEDHTVFQAIQSRLLIERMVLGGPAAMHAINTNEGETLKSNSRYGKLLPYPLAFVFPADGSFWAGHPMCVLDASWVTADQREAAAIYTRYLLEPEQQALAVEKGLRPANPLVPLHDPISLPYGTDPRVTPQTVPSLASPAPESSQAIRDLYAQVTQPR